MRPILPCGVFGGFPRQGLAIYAHVPKPLSIKAADVGESDECKGYKDYMLEEFIHAYAILSSMAFWASVEHFNMGQFVMKDKRT